MFADRITNSMQRAIDDNLMKRKRQTAYNKKHNITPIQIAKSAKSALVAKLNPYTIKEENTEVDIAKLSQKELQKMIRETKGKMDSAAKEFDFIYAGKLRDKLLKIRKRLKSKK